MNYYNQLGLLRCARYSFAPNQLHFCGPQKQTEMSAYISQNIADVGLGEILSQFDTLYKYLIFIAVENGYKEPFDPKVVEAYWLGNNLLSKINIRALASHLVDTLELKRKLTSKKLGKLLMKVDRAFPHHTFHVLNIYRRTGHLPISHTLETMDNCRISWGKVIAAQTQNGKSSFLYISTNPLIYESDKIKLGLPIKKQILSFTDKIKIGDWVSFHWGVVCEKISEAQKQQLQYYTQKAIQLANYR